MGQAEDVRGMWVHLFPAPDVRGQWLADGLEVGWMTDGTSRLNALERFIEGVQVLDLESRDLGRDFMTISPTPVEEWPECMRRAESLTKLRTLTRQDLSNRNAQQREYVLILAVPIPKKRIVRAQGAALERLLRRSYLVTG